MNMKNKYWPLFALLILAQPLSAAHMSDSGEGEVLVFPYYTVNNDLATLVKINNNRNAAKAIKVNFLEGNNMAMALSYNVYLGPHDSWELALVATTSTIGPVVGQDSVMHVTADTSCAPYLNKAGQEFLPFDLETIGSDSAVNMERVTQGMIQVFEMAELPDDVAAWADHGNVGVPANCGAFVNEWNDGEWNASELLPATGGLSGTTTIIDVAEGSSVTYNADAIGNFYTPGEIIHTEPGSLLPNLDSAMPKSVVYSEGKIHESNWETGADAISALFMSQSISNDFILGSFIAAKTEWVVSFPTKKFYVNGDVPKAPFQSLYQTDEGACVNFGGIRNFPTSYGGGYGEPIGDFGGQVCTPPPRPELKTMCWASNVMFFYNCEPGNTKEEGAQILGAYNNQYGIRVKPFEIGKSTIDFSTMPDYEDNALKDADGINAYHGFPVTGFAISKFTNSGAQPGLLAQYANLRKHNFEKDIIAETD
jgi:hypothetical protein